MLARIGQGEERKTEAAAEGGEVAIEEGITGCVRFLRSALR